MIHHYLHFLLFGSILLMMSCSNDETFLSDQLHQNHITRSVDQTLQYPLQSFTESIEINSLTTKRVDAILSTMQTTLGGGYNPLFVKLQAVPIACIRSGNIQNGAAASYNTLTNTVTLNSATLVIQNNMLEEELIHAGQDRIYIGGIGQYAYKAGTSNIEFEAKLTQDLIAYVNDFPFNLGAGPNNENEYAAWLLKICGDVSDPKFPSMNTVLTVKEGNDGYYQMVEAFKTKAPQYDYPVLTTLKPLYINYTHKYYGMY